MHLAKSCSPAVTLFMWYTADDTSRAIHSSHTYSWEKGGVDKMCLCWQDRVEVVENTICPW